MSSNETAEVIIIVLKRIGKRILFGLIAVGLLIGSLFAYSSIESYYRNLPKLVTEINGITLGEKISDTLFKHSGFVNMGKNKMAEDFENEDYFYNSSTGIYIEIKENKVEAVRYECDASFEITSVNGISCRDSGEEIQERFSKELRILCLKDTENEEAPSYRVYDVPKYGVRYLLKTNSVIAFAVTNPTSLLDANSKRLKNWISCS